jgi:hypothetical protein
MAFMSVTQCEYGAGQAGMPIYLEGKPKALRSCGHECASLEQPFSLVPSQWAKGNCKG